jgi:hypothetical protein
VLVHRKKSGEYEVYDRPVFHIGCSGEALEMREFSEVALKQALAAAGFSDARICAESCPQFGVVQAEPWSLPIVARKAPSVLGRDAVRDVVEEWRRVIERFDAMARSRWFRLGCRLGWY